MNPEHPVIFTDTETFGLDPNMHRIWEVAVIDDDGTEFLWQVEWPQEVLDAAQPKALEMTGFAERSLQLNPDPSNRVNLLSPADSARLFADIADGKHLAGAVVSFDEERLRRMHVEHLGMPDRFPWHYHLIDVEALAIGYLAHEAQVRAERLFVSPPWKSDELSKHLGIVTPEGDQRHTAMADARWARDIYMAVMG